MYKYSFFLLSIFALHLSWAQQVKAVDTVDIATMGKNFIETLAQKQFSQAEQNFDDTMKQVFPVEKLEEFWIKLVSQLGNLDEITGIRISKYQEKGETYDVVYVVCKFNNIYLEAKIVYNSSHQIAGFFIKPYQGKYQRPAYVDFDSFNEEDVQIGEGPWALPGTLTIPKGPGPFPAVVLVHGSGPNDRDETIGPNKPFRDIAWGLASRNIAVLRYDKRTKAHSAKIQAIEGQLTIREVTVDDALLAVALLRKYAEIDSIFVMGHSLGGLMIPQIGTEDTGLDGLIMMAAPTRRLEDILLEQIHYIFSLDKELSEAEKTQLEHIRAQVAKVKDVNLSPDTPTSDLPLGISARFWLSIRDYDQVEKAKKLKQPLLILQGERDYQVTMVDFRGWKEALWTNENVDCISYPALNHLMCQGEGVCRPEEYLIESHVSEKVIEDITRWIRRVSTTASLRRQLRELQKSSQELQAQRDTLAKAGIVSDRSYHAVYSVEASALRVKNLELARRVLERAKQRGWIVVTAESVTAGNLAATLACCPSAGETFAGGVVCYKIEAKRQLLRVPDTREEELYDLQTVLDMAQGVVKLYSISEESKTSLQPESYFGKNIFAIATTGRAVSYAGHWEGGVYVAIAIQGKEQQAAYFQHQFKNLSGADDEARTKEEGMLVAVNKALEYALRYLE